ncbi:MAG: hypothetical protein ACI8WM_000688 [Burkholderiaceae bacterium]|jgi:hypothetical protein
MSVSRSGASTNISPIVLDGGEIYTSSPVHSPPNLSSSQLKEYERDASINLVGRNVGRSIDTLTSFLGLSLTAGSVAWSGDPVPKMRALQKKFLEFGMTCEGEDRQRALAAISVVEKNIQWRLRLHQLHMSELQQTSDQGGPKS